MERFELRQGDEIAVALLQQREQALAETADNGHHLGAVRFEPVDIGVDVAKLDIEQLRATGSPCSR